MVRVYMRLETAQGPKTVVMSHVPELSARIMGLPFDHQAKFPSFVVEEDRPGVNYAQWRAEQSRRQG